MVKPSFLETTRGPPETSLCTLSAAMATLDINPKADWKSWNSSELGAAVWYHGDRFESGYGTHYGELW